MKFVYQYRTSDNVQHEDVIAASSRDDAYARLKAKGIRPGRVTEAPGFFNNLFGRGKRWLAIAALAGLVVALAVALLRVGRDAGRLADFDGLTRRQVIGDSAVIEKGIRTGWADFFEREGDRFFASFAIPGVPAAIRSTSEDEIRRVLDADPEKSPDVDSIEARQIRAMVEGIKRELRQFLADGGTVVEYGQRLVQRQEQEIAYYTRAKTEIETAHASGMDAASVLDLWEKRNASLRRMGIRLIPLPE